MTVWKITMLALLVFGLFSSSARWPRLRVGVAMFGTSFIAALYPNLWFYLAIDIVIAFIILLPPRTVWQRAIGFCYVGMSLLTVGYLTALHIFLSTADNTAMLMQGYEVLTWSATALLFFWGFDGLLGSVRTVSGDSDDKALERASP